MEFDTNTSSQDLSTSSSLSVSARSRASSIHLLPEHIIDQIKAGEVIDGPAGLIKEILENSLDAQATILRLNLKSLGLELIELEDNGTGILFEELPLAFTRHATSKLSDLMDLYRIQTHGFRGEALASIASVAKVDCLSKSHLINNSKQGGLYSIEGSKILKHEPWPKDSAGTILSIKDLFFNTPVRLNFIQNQSLLKKQLKFILNGLILSTPSIRWHIEAEELHLSNESFFETTSTPISIGDYKKSSQENRAKILSQRFTQVYSEFQLSQFQITAPQELQKNLKEETQHLTLFQRYEDHEIIFIIPNSINSTKEQAPLKKRKEKKYHRDDQFLVVNDRRIEHKKLNSIIIQILKGHTKNQWNEEKVFPFYLQLQVPEHLLDVNVHPHKTEVRFMKEDIIFGLVKAILKSLPLRKNQINSEQSNLSISDLPSPSSPSIATSQEITKNIHDHNLYKTLTVPSAELSPYLSQDHFYYLLPVHQKVDKEDAPQLWQCTQMPRYNFDKQAGYNFNKMIELKIFSLSEFLLSFFQDFELDHNSHSHDQLQWTNYVVARAFQFSLSFESSEQHSSHTHLAPTIRKVFSSLALSIDFDFSSDSEIFLLLNGHHKMWKEESIKNLLHHLFAEKKIFYLSSNPSKNEIMDFLSQHLDIEIQYDILKNTINADLWKNIKDCHNKSYE